MSIFEFFFLWLFICSFVSLIIGIVGLVRTPKDNVQKRKSYKIMIIVPLAILGTLIIVIVMLFIMLTHALAKGM